MTRPISELLRPYQRAFVEKLTARADKRLIFWGGTAAGKTFASIAAAKACNAERILVVVPAMVRPNWVAEFRTWTPEIQVAPIRFGAGNNSLTKAQRWERDLSYVAPTQIVSYNLLPHIKTGTRDFVIFDECHALRSPTSKQSKLARTFMSTHTGGAAALTATLVPKEVRQVWNQVDTLFPGWYGKRSKTGEEPWAFLTRFCEKTVNEYGTSFHGANSEAMPELERLLAPYIHRVTQADYAEFLPPLDASLAFCDDPKNLPEDYAVEWLESLCREKTHMAVACHTHEMQARLEAAVRSSRELREFPLFVTNGLQSAEVRQSLYHAARESERAIMLSTRKSMDTGVNLSFNQAALFIEWATDPAGALQLIGRYWRPGSPDSVMIRYLTYESDMIRLERISERLASITDLSKTDEGVKRLAAVFVEPEMTESRASSLESSVLGRTTANYLSFDDEDDSDD